MSKQDELIFTDRYGGNYPDPKTVCEGQCEGMGVYPEKQLNGKYKFIKCEECNGTGKKQAR